MQGGYLSTHALLVSILPKLLWCSCCSCKSTLSSKNIHFLHLCLSCRPLTNLYLGLRHRGNLWRICTNRSGRCTLCTWFMTVERTLISVHCQRRCTIMKSNAIKRHTTLGLSTAPTNTTVHQVSIKTCNGTCIVPSVSKVELPKAFVPETLLKLNIDDGSALLTNSLHRICAKSYHTKSPWSWVWQSSSPIEWFKFYVRYWRWFPNTCSKLNSFPIWLLNVQLIDAILGNCF